MRELFTAKISVREYICRNRRMIITIIALTTKTFLTGRLPEAITLPYLRSSRSINVSTIMSASISTSIVGRLDYFPVENIFSSSVRIHP